MRLVDCVLSLTEIKFPLKVFKEEPGLRTAWYSANVLSLEDDKAYVLFNDLSVEQGLCIYQHGFLQISIYHQIF